MELFGVTVGSSLIWIGIAVLFAAIEAFTLGITTIWFSLGAVAAVFTSTAGGSVLAQIVVFLAVSVLLLYFTRPIAVKKLKIGSVKTNVDTLPGQTALVLEDIGPYSTGQVKVQGQVWTAIIEGKAPVVQRGETVIILRVEGVKLVVKSLKEPNIKEE